MAGLPCEACQEETAVVPSGVVGEDADGRMVFRRYRACMNPRCERFRHRRETMEFYLPDPPAPVLVDTIQFNNRAGSVPDASLPSLFDDF